MEFRNPFSHAVRGRGDSGVTVYEDFDHINTIYRARRFGSFWARLLSYLPIVDAGAVQRLHWNVNTWTDEEVFAWKDSHLSNCNANVIAGAIFAGIGLSALQLPNMTEVHWTAHACCVCSMVLGVLSVTTATQQYQDVGMLNTAIQIRLWLSRGRPGPKSQGDILSRDKGNGFGSIEENGRPQTHRYSGFPAFEHLPLESSMAALNATNLSRYLLFGAVFIFIIGIGLWEIFQWVQPIDNSGIGNRNIFIVFIITVCVCATYEAVLRRVQHNNQVKRDVEFDTTAFGGYSPMRSLQKLEELQTELNAAREKMLKRQSSENNDTGLLRASVKDLADQRYPHGVMAEAAEDRRQKQGNNGGWESSVMAFPRTENASKVMYDRKEEKA